MHTITTNYDLIRQFKAAPHIRIDSRGVLINIKRDKVIPKKLNGRSIGYWIGRDFIPDSRINELTEPIPYIEVPF
jgi:hypothetical protein